MDEIKGRPHPGWAWLTLFGGVSTGALALWFGIKWLTTDEVDVYGTYCRSGSNCLQSGETLNMVFTLVWGPFGLAGVLGGLALLARNRRRAAADRLLLETGSRAEALITDVREHGSVTRTNGRITSQGYLLTLDAGDGGEPLVVKAQLPYGLRPGGRVRVLFDPATRDAALLDDPTEAAPAGLALA